MGIAHMRRVAAVPAQELERTAEMGAEAIAALHGPGSYDASAEFRVVAEMLNSARRQPEATSTIHGRHIVEFLEGAQKAWIQERSRREVAK